MPGLDPGIHLSSKSLAKTMDCRVKPGNDEEENEWDDIGESLDSPPPNPEKAPPAQQDRP
jgi:hypothetical protein